MFDIDFDFDFFCDADAHAVGLSKRSAHSTRLPSHSVYRIKMKMRSETSAMRTTMNRMEEDFGAMKIRSPKEKSNHPGRWVELDCHSMLGHVPTRIPACPTRARLGAEPVPMGTGVRTSIRPVRGSGASPTKKGRNIPSAKLFDG